MAKPVAVLLLDDGELDDVQRVLEDLGIPFGRVRGGAIAAGTPSPTDLFVATPRRVDCVRRPNGSGEEPIRMVVADEDSPTLRAKLREIGFDFLVRRPVHEEALRLLVTHCLYRGEERRSEPRVPIGLEIRFKTGLATQRGTMADLSRHGCRLLTSQALQPGSRIKLRIPKSDGEEACFDVRGRVVRMSIDERLDPSGLYATAVAFERVTTEAQAEIEGLLERHARGPAMLHPNAPDAARLGDGAGENDAARETPRSRSLDASPSGSGDSEPDALFQERRKVRRGAFASRVPAFGKRALRVLVGRDLSTGGMRVEPQSALEVGERLHLALYGDSRRDPILVWATVSRDDGEEGMAIVFDPLEGSDAAQLERLVAGLPAVESLHDDEAEAMGTVVSEILER